MFVSMDNSLFGNNQKTLANYSLSGHPIKFCEAKWQVTYKKILIHSNLFLIRLIGRKKVTQIITNMPN